MVCFHWVQWNNLLGMTRKKKKKKQPFESVNYWQLEEIPKGAAHGQRTVFGNILGMAIASLWAMAILLIFGMIVGYRMVLNWWMQQRSLLWIICFQILWACTTILVQVGSRVVWALFSYKLTLESYWASSPSFGAGSIIQYFSASL